MNLKQLSEEIDNIDKLMSNSQVYILDNYDTLH